MASGDTCCLRLLCHLHWLCPHVLVRAAWMPQWAGNTSSWEAGISGGRRLAAHTQRSVTVRPFPCCEPEGGEAGPEGPCSWCVLVTVRGGLRGGQWWQLPGVAACRLESDIHTPRPALRSPPPARAPAVPRPWPSSPRACLLAPPPHVALAPLPAPRPPGCSPRPPSQGLLACTAQRRSLPWTPGPSSQRPPLPASVCRMTDSFDPGVIPLSCIVT